MHNANTVDGLGYLFAVFQIFPLLRVLLVAFVVYLLVRSVFTYRSATPILSGQHYLEGTLVFHGDLYDTRKKYINSNIRIGSEYHEFATRLHERKRLPDLKVGEPARIYFAPSMPRIRFLWVPTPADLMKRIFSFHVIRPIAGFFLAVIAFWLLPMIFFMN